MGFHPTNLPELISAFGTTAAEVSNFTLIVQHSPMHSSADAFIGILSPVTVNTGYLGLSGLHDLVGYLRLSLGWHVGT